MTENTPCLPIRKHTHAIQALACGLPRHPTLLNDAIPSALAAAVALGGLNLLQVWDSRSPEAGAAVRQGLQVLFDSGCVGGEVPKPNDVREMRPRIHTQTATHQPRSLHYSAASRPQLVTMATLDPGALGDRGALQRSIDEGRAATGLEVLDLAIVRLDLSRGGSASPSSSSSSTGPRHPRGRLRTLLEELRRTMEELDELCSPSASTPIQAYGFDLRLPFAAQPKSPLSEAPLTPEEAEEQQLFSLLPSMLEAAAEVQGSKLALLSAPAHITDRFPLWLMEDDAATEAAAGAEGGGKSQKGKPAVLRVARGPLLGYAAAGGTRQPVPISFSSQLLPPNAVAAISRTLDELAPALRPTKLLEAKVLQTVVATASSGFGPHAALLDLVK